MNEKMSSDMDSWLLKQFYNPFYHKIKSDLRAIIHNKFYYEYNSPLKVQLNAQLGNQLRDALLHE